MEGSEHKAACVRLAALVACHNRKENTLACLRALFEQVRNGEVWTHAYVVDAGSTDGTAEAIAECFSFSEVELIRADENLFWCGGMRVAFEQAMKEDYDYYLWLNDDTILRPGATRGLLRTAHEVRERQGQPGIIVGSACDPETGEFTYGGGVRVSRLRPLGFRPVIPSDEPQRCATFNGNCVLVPREVARVVGNLSPEFTHAIADTDYGLRAEANGLSSWVAPGYVGTCYRNRSADLWFDRGLSFRKRLKILRSPKGLPPREWRIFARRHAPVQWPIYWISVYLHVCFPCCWLWLRRVRDRIREPGRHP